MHTTFPKAASMRLTIEADNESMALAGDILGQCLQLKVLPLSLLNGNASSRCLNIPIGSEPEVVELIHLNGPPKHFVKDLR